MSNPATPGRPGSPQRPPAGRGAATGGGGAGPQGPPETVGESAGDAGRSPDALREPAGGRRPAAQTPQGGGGRGETLAFVESPAQLLNVLEWAHAVPGRAADGTTVVVLPPQDPMTRGQLRRMAELARDEGHAVRWAEARGGAAPLRTVGSLAGPLRRAARVVIGDPFSRYVQLLLSLTSAPEVVVVDDGTATMEFLAQLVRGERLTRWHRRGAGGLRNALFTPVARRARGRLVPSGGRRPRRVTVFSAMPVEPGVAELGLTVAHNAFAWTRARFGPPRLADGADLVGTSLVETGVVDLDRYVEAVAALARGHAARRYFAHRRESAAKLRRVAAEAGLEVVRPDLPLELVARRGPVGRTVLSFPSTVVHTLPRALEGTGVRVEVCDVDPAWLTADASPRAEEFLAGVTRTAPAARRPA